VCRGMHTPGTFSDAEHPDQGKDDHAALCHNGWGSRRMRDIAKQHVASHCYGVGHRIATFTQDNAASETAVGSACALVAGVPMISCVACLGADIRGAQAGTHSPMPHEGRRTFHG
jgi:hypothetical protein